jgi:hypothetical protein
MYAGVGEPGRRLVCWVSIDSGRLGRGAASGGEDGESFVKLFSGLRSELVVSNFFLLAFSRMQGSYRFECSLSLRRISVLMSRHGNAGCSLRFFIRA